MAANPFYKDYATFLSAIFGSGKVQKLSIDLGHSCPNRDGTIGRGGCIYCNNATFSPGYTAASADVIAQLEEGKAFFARKYPQMRYLAYFQSYTSTHGRPIAELMEQYRVAADYPGIVGLVIATRPDCMPAALLAGLSELNKQVPVIIEYGVESSHDATLRLVNRCHTWQQAADAVTRTAAAGMHVGVHLIMGLPGEDRAMMLQTVRRINALPVSTVKFHQLQVVRGSRLAAMVEKGQMMVPVFSLADYLDLCVDLVDTLRPDIAIDRFTAQSPAQLLIAPRWGLKNHEFTALLHKRLALRHHQP